MIKINYKRINNSNTEYILIHLHGQSNIGRADNVYPSYLPTGVALTDCEVWDEVTQEYVDLVPGVNGAPLTSDTQYGFAHELGYRLKLLYPDKKIRFYLTARGGAGLTYGVIPSFLHSSWKDDPVVNEDGNWWQLTQSQWTEASTGFNYIDFGSLWFQGETDATDDNEYSSLNYQSLEKSLIDEHNELYGLKDWICINIHPDIVNNPSFTNASNVTRVRQAKVNNSNNGVYTFYRDSSDVGLKSDSLHINVNAVQVISEWIIANVYTD